MASASGVSGSHAPSTSQASSGLDLSGLLEALDDSIIDERDWSEHAMRNRERRLAIRHRRFAMLSPYHRPLPINARTAEHSHAQLVIKYYQRGYLLTNERANGSYIEETPIPFVWETIRITELRGQSLRRKEDREYYARAIVKAINRMRRVPIEVLLYVAYYPFFYFSFIHITQGVIGKGEGQGCGTRWWRRDRARGRR